MIQRLPVILFLILSIGMSYAQKTDKVLLEVDGEPIMVSEFLRVYNKNLDLVKDESQKNIDGYLELFTQYQLKLQEAKRLKLDQDSKYKREFDRYKKQLTKTYLSESKVTEQLVVEAFERSALDVNASHILVRLEESANDTISAYNKVLELRQRAITEGFDKLKAEVHDGKTIFLEDLGYFSAFKMVYDFETKAYNTPVGEFSMPFRTQFGYHAVLVKDKRPSRGTITAAHIMIATNQKDSTLNPEQRIKEIYAKLNQGEGFESLAKQFSDDKSSARNGGQLSPFKSGQLNSLKFEDEAFALEKDGDYSKPFQTDYGWHIVKRLKLESKKSFEDLKPQLENRIKRDSRSRLINSAMVNELKNRYKISYDSDAKAYFTSVLSEAFFSRSWELPVDLKKDKSIFRINNRTFTYGQFGRHLIAAQRLYFNKKTEFSSIIQKEYDAFFEKSIFKFREDNLENENKDFAHILKEYRDGLLLFDLMEKEIWNKAAKDSTGLAEYYDKHKSKYQWSDRVELIMVSSAQKSIAKKARKMLSAGTAKDKISEALNTADQQNIIFTEGVFDLNDDKLPKGFEAVKGVSEIYSHNDAFHVLKVLQLLPAAQKTFEEAKGNVINDYQNELEKNWIAELESRFEVKVNEEALQEVKTQLKN